MATTKKSTTGDIISKEFIEVFGAREHNLKDIDIKIPKNQLVVFTGVSGSGKSSLAFDTIYNDEQVTQYVSFTTWQKKGCLEIAFETAVNQNYFQFFMLFQSY